MKRLNFFGGNWKMNHNLKTALEFCTNSKTLNWSAKEKEVVIFPPAHLLLPLKKDCPLSVGAQNCYYEDKGAFTGEISAQMLVDEKIEYTIIGHSERRSIFKEDDALLKQKILKSLDKGLSVIFCVGESLEQREKNEHFSVIESQLKAALFGLQLSDASKLVVAYEPVWAIGTGKTASPQQAEEMHAFIRKALADLQLDAESIRIIYGGSVKPSNVKELMQNPNIDGALVGGASLKAVDFNQIVNY